MIDLSMNFQDKIEKAKNQSEKSKSSSRRDRNLVSNRFKMKASNLTTLMLVLMLLMKGVQVIQASCTSTDG